MDALRNIHRAVKDDDDYMLDMILLSVHDACHLEGVCTGGEEFFAVSFCKG